MSGTLKSDGPGPRPAGSDDPLVAQAEGCPVEVVNPEGAGGVLVICEHASNRIPMSLNGLGLSKEALVSHVAWDPGAEAVARAMAERLEAPLILQRFSRLVYDCNRPPDAESAMPATGETFAIPGNEGLTKAARQARVEAIYRPFENEIAACLDRSAARGLAPAIVTVHSFTPMFFGRRREVEVGLLHDIDARLADAMLASGLDFGAQGLGNLDVRRNEPYGPEDGVTHTLQVHALPRGLLNVMIEIRNDLILGPDRQLAMASGLAMLVDEALRHLPETDGGQPRRRGAAR